MGPREPAHRPTFGVLYAGEMGSALGRLLSRAGYRVVTTLQARGPRTRRLADAGGFFVVGSLREAAETADVMLSLVPPARAAEVAQEYAGLRPAPPRTFVDLNSVSPATAARIGALIESAGLEFVDGAIHGLASRLPEHGTVYLSGRNAPSVARRLGEAVSVKVLGADPGRASAFKMLVSGMAKGVVALFLEMAVAARRADLLPELLECYRDAYPGVMELVERLLPTYPRHGARRVQELAEAEDTLRSWGVTPSMTAAAGRVTAGVAGPAPDATGAADRGEWSVTEVLEEVTRRYPPAGG